MKAQDGNNGNENGSENRNEDESENEGENEEQHRFESSHNADTTETQTKSKTNSKIRIFADGSGCRPDSTGSSFAWFREDTGEREVFRVDGLTNNQAEYRGILAALGAVPPGTEVEILTDSQSVCYQLRGAYRVLDPQLAELNLQVYELTRKKRLNVTFTWIPRNLNLAGKLIRRQCNLIRQSS